MSRRRKQAQADAANSRPIRCAIYTRKSSEEGLDQEFNSLDAQREGAEAFIASQKAEDLDLVHVTDDPEDAVRVIVEAKRGTAGRKS